MPRTVFVVFDGEVFRPTEPLDLPANREYLVTINAREPSPPDDDWPLMRYLKLAQPLGVSDLAEQHDHYARGTPKQ
jgi:hypothetical protein